MFYNCSSLENLNLSNFNTENVISMEYMFANCEYLQNLDISNFNLTNCNNTDSMFDNIYIDIGPLIGNNEDLMENIFEKTSQIIKIIKKSKNSDRRLDIEAGEESFMMKILGDDFDELNYENSDIYINGHKVEFNKCIPIDPNENINVLITIPKKLKTFKEMFSGCNEINEVILKNIEIESEIETNSMFDLFTVPKNKNNITHENIFEGDNPAEKKLNVKIIK